MPDLLVEGEPVEDASPDPAALIESLRAFGYDLPAAIADLIDNSVAAHAGKVWIRFNWHGNASKISIRDNGKGMDDARLLQAMRLGSTSPRELRRESDMGRFGLGLKTASFSQCRLVAIRSKTGPGPTCERCWDLDLVAKTHRWYVRKQIPSDLSPEAAELAESKSGTVVIWSRLDRVIGHRGIEGSSAQQDFYRLADDVCRHLQITFSDFIRRGELQISVNGTPLKPWDPFLERHPATQELGVESLVLEQARITVAAYVLPHFSKLSAQEYELGAGPDGWLASQGFYVYRNRRLLVAADWLGLGLRKERHFELARIRIDISNTTDEDWRLDVKKCRAVPPVALRGDLKRIAKIARTRASEVYKHRGARLIPNSSSEKVFLWIPSRRHGKNFYRLERSHPVVRAVEEACDEPGVFSALLRLLEETVPTPLITMNSSEEPTLQSTPFEGVAASEVLRTMASVYTAMRELGQSKEDALRRLAHVEPFDRFPELLATFKPTD
jgi:hypothetical protein